MKDPRSWSEWPKREPFGSVETRARAAFAASEFVDQWDLWDFWETSDRPVNQSRGLIPVIPRIPEIRNFKAVLLHVREDAQAAYHPKRGAQDDDSTPLNASIAERSRGINASIASTEITPTDRRNQPLSPGAPNALNGTVPSPAAFSR